MPRGSLPLSTLISPSRSAGETYPHSALRHRDLHSQRGGVTPCRYSGTLPPRNPATARTPVGREKSVSELERLHSLPSSYHLHQRWKGGNALTRPGARMRQNLQSGKCNDKAAAVSRAKFRQLSTHGTSRPGGGGGPVDR